MTIFTKLFFFHASATKLAHARRWITLAFTLSFLSITHAFLPPDPGGGGGGGSGGTPLEKCLQNTEYRQFGATPETIDPGGSATLTWSIRPPSNCYLFNRVLVNGAFYGLTGSLAVQPLATTDYTVMLIVTGGFIPLGPIRVTVNRPPIVNISPGTQVSAQDVAQFDARWMGADLQKRLDDYNLFLKNRQAWIAWGVADTTSAMIRMFELTRDWKYLNHLRDVDNIALKYRDDNHLGDDFPNGGNPDCLNCRPPFVDRERGIVKPAAWGSGILYTDYVIDGGLTPVDAVTSGVYAYGIAAFARIVAEDASLHDVYGADAVKFANAIMQTLWVFIPEFDARQVGSNVEGTINRPALFPTPAQCAEARDDAVEHVNQFNGGDADRLSKINKAKSDCDETGLYADKPLAHNESGALMMAFIELWRALDSDFYRQSPLRASDADLARGVIPLIVARHQRYFVNVNRLKIKNDVPQGQRYSWNYNDDVPDPRTEDTSHGNLDMSYLNVLRLSFDRLNAEVAPGEPIPLDDAMVRRFANTFLGQIARPDEIDRGGNLRSNVDGRPPEDNGKGGPDYNNTLCDGWVNLASADATVYRLCRDVSLRTSVRKDEVFQDYLTIANHAALLANKRFSMGR